MHFFGWIKESKNTFKKSQNMFLYEIIFFLSEKDLLKLLLCETNKDIATPDFFFKR